MAAVVIVSPWRGWLSSDTFLRADLLQSGKIMRSAIERDTDRSR